MQSDICLFNGLFNSFTFNVIINMIEFTSAIFHFLNIYLSFSFLYSFFITYFCIKWSNWISNFFCEFIWYFSFLRGCSRAYNISLIYQNLLQIYTDLIPKHRNFTPLIAPFTSHPFTLSLLYILCAHVFYIWYKLL